MTASDRLVLFYLIVALLFGAVTFVVLPALADWLDDAADAETRRAARHTRTAWHGTDNTGAAKDDGRDATWHLERAERLRDQAYTDRRQAQAARLLAGTGPGLLSALLLGMVWPLSCILLGQCGAYHLHAHKASRRHDGREDHDETQDGL